MTKLDWARARERDRGRPPSITDRWTPPRGRLRGRIAQPVVHTTLPFQYLCPVCPMAFARYRHDQGPLKCTTCGTVMARITTE